MMKLRLLGGQNLIDPSGEEVLSLLSQPKRMAVLSYLALAGRGRFLRRDVLLALFWPESDLHRARNALNQILHALRKEMGEGLLRTRGKHEVGLDPDQLECDVWSFRDAVRSGSHERALSFYAGPLMPGFHLDNNGGDFGRWLEEEREGLREMAASAAWGLANQKVRSGALVEAERTAQRALSLVGTDETPVRDFVSALAEAGDRAAALRFYKKFCSRLREELELEPSLQTVALVEGIRAGEWSPPPQAPVVGTVREKSGPEPPEEVETPSVAGGAGIPSAKEGTDIRSGDGKRWGQWALAISLLVIILLVILAERHRRGSVWHPNPRNVAVAPFVNRTGDPDQDGFGLLIAENIRVRLDQAEIGEVFPQPVTNSALERAGPDADPLVTLSRDLGAGVVVTGEFFFRGDSLIISSYCIDARDGRDLGPMEPARGSRAEELQVIGQVQDRVSGVLAQHLEPAYAGRRTVRPPLNVEAFRAYQRAYDAQSGTEEDVRIIVPLLYRAFQEDTTYMAPLIRAWFLLMWWEENGSERGVHVAERDSLFSLLDQSRYLMSTAQSRWMDWVRAEFQSPRNPEAALATARLAFEAAPTDFAYELGLSAARLNYLDEALKAFRLYEKGDGEFLEALTDYNYFYDYAQVLHRLGLHGKELEILRAGRRRFPEMRTLPMLELRALVALGRIAEATELAERVPRWGNWTYLSHPAQLDFLGYREEATAFLEKEVERFELDSLYRADPMARAGVLSALGRQGDALAILERLFQEDPNRQGLLRMMGTVSARVGDTARAREMDRRLAEIPNVRENPWARAFLAGAMGEKNRALDFMKQITPTQGGWFMFRYGFEFRTLQGYPPYEDFLRPKR